MLRPVLIALLALSAVPARAAELRIRGLEALTEQAAITELRGRLEFTKERPATASRADDAAFLLQRLLVQKGFTDPTVDFELPGNNEILLIVREGPRSSLGKVYVKGVEDKPELLEEIRKQVASAHTARTRRLGEDIPYLEEHSAPAVQDALDLLRSKGYWKATVRLARTVRNDRTTKVDIFIDATRGPLHTLLPFQFENTGSSQPDLVARLEKFAGRVATAQEMRNARARVEKFYRKRGYQFADVKMLVTHRNTKTQLRFVVKAGARYKVGDIAVTGVERTRPGLIEDRFRSLQGKDYDGDAFNTEIRELLGTGAFSGVQLRQVPREDGLVDLTLEVTEAKPHGYYFYGGAGSYEGYILGAGYYHRNLFGRLWNLSTRLEWTGLGPLGEVSVTEPRFLGYDLRFTASAFLTSRTFEGYSKAEAGIGTELEWDVTEDYTIKASFRNSLTSLATDGLPRSELGPDGYFLNVLGVSQVFDKRDNPVLPKDGVLLQLDTDLGLAFSQESVSFVRAQAHASYYKSVFDKGAVALGARAGVIIPSSGEAGLPVDLRYFLGGSTTVRSFPERELGPEADNGIPRGGESYWVANAEYIHKIAGPLNGVIFLDAGSLNRDHGELFAGDVKYALGLGLRLDLPIGPVRFEYGHALNPEGSDPRGAFHFAIGVTF